MSNIALPDVITVPLNQPAKQRRAAHRTNGTVTVSTGSTSSEMSVLNDTTNMQPAGVKLAPKASRYARMYDKDEDADTGAAPPGATVQVGTIDAINSKPQQYVDNDISEIRAKHSTAPVTSKQSRHVFMSDNGVSVLSQQHNKPTPLSDDSDEELSMFAKPFAAPSASIPAAIKPQITTDQPTVTVSRSTITSTLLNDNVHAAKPTVSNKDSTITDDSDVDIAFDDIADNLLPITPVSTALTPSRKGHNRQLTPAITDILTVETPKRNTAMPVLSEADDYSNTHSQQSSIDSSVNADAAARTAQPETFTTTNHSSDTAESNEDTVSDTLTAAPVVERKLSAHRRTATPQVADTIIELHSTQPTVQTITEEGHNRTATPNVSDIVPVVKSLRPTTSIIAEESDAESTDTSPIKCMPTTAPPADSANAPEIDDEFSDAYSMAPAAVTQDKAPRKLLKPSKQQLAKETAAVVDTSDDMLLLNNDTTTAVSSAPSATFGNIAQNGYSDGLSVLNKYAVPANAVAASAAVTAAPADEFADVPAPAVVTTKATNIAASVRNVTIKYSDAVQQLSRTIDVDQHITHIVTYDPRKLSFFIRLAYTISKPALKTESLRNQLNVWFGTAATKFDQSIPLHDQVLCSVYKSLTGNAVAPNAYGEHWSYIGFQCSDPSTDTRSSGMLGILQMLYLCNAHRQLALDIHQLSNDAKQHFPLAITLFQLTGVVMQTLRECKLYARINKCNDVFTVCNELYAALTHRFYSEWKQRKCTISEFNTVKQLISEECRKNPLKLIKQFESAQSGSTASKASKKVEFADL